MELKMGFLHAILYSTFAVGLSHQGVHSFLDLMRQQCDSWCESEGRLSIAPIRSKAGPRGIPGARGPPGIVNMTEVEEIIDQKLENFRQQSQAVIADIERRLDMFERNKNEIDARLDVIERMIPPEFTEANCYMGMKSGSIADSQLTASSTHALYPLAKARLDMTGVINNGCWAANAPSSGQWIQVDLGRKRSIAGIILQGSPTNDQWVTTYRVNCNGRMVKESGKEKIFDGNTDSNSKVIGKFPTPLDCRTVRIVVLSWHGWIKLRFELINGACFHSI